MPRAITNAIPAAARTNVCRVTGRSPAETEHVLDVLLAQAAEHEGHDDDGDLVQAARDDHR